MLSAAVSQLAPRARCPLQCLLTKTVSRCGQVWRICSGVYSSELHSQWAESAIPNLFRCFLNPQWPVRRWRIVVWVLLSKVLVCLSVGHIHCFSVSRLISASRNLSKSRFEMLLSHEACKTFETGHCRLLRKEHLFVRYFFNICIHLCIHLGEQVIF